MKFQFFGDTHGETHWKHLLDPECVQVFLGDYFSPYNGQSYEKCKDNFIEILSLKENKPETILLIGNHDEDHWHIREGYSRFDIYNVENIASLFESNKDKLQVAASIGDYLITHAGVTSEWVKRKLPNVEINPQSLASAINKLWLNGKYSAFNFRDNASYFDYYGETERHGPMWIRWEPLCKYNVFKGTNYKQIVGHTSAPDFRFSPNKATWNLICIDCLAYQPKSLILDINP